MAARQASLASGLINYDNARRHTTPAYICHSGGDDGVDDRKKKSQKWK